MTDVQRGCGIIFIPAPARGRSFSTANSEPARFDDCVGRVAKHIAAAARARGRGTRAVCALLLFAARKPLLNETRTAQARGFSLLEGEKARPGHKEWPASSRLDDRACRIAERTAAGARARSRETRAVGARFVRADFSCACARMTVTQILGALLRCFPAFSGSIATGIRVSWSHGSHPAFSSSSSHCPVME